jgi:hypothetical protein
MDGGGITKKKEIGEREREKNNKINELALYTQSRLSPRSQLTINRVHNFVSLIRFCLATPGRPSASRCWQFLFIFEQGGGGVVNDWRKH